MQFHVEPISKHMGGGSLVILVDERDKNRVHASAVVRGTVTEKHVRKLQNGVKAPSLPFKRQLAPLFQA